MAVLIVVNNPAHWRLPRSGVEVVSARSYLSEARFSDLRGVKIFNLCRSYRYQNMGYYVSLLAEARGHRPMPSITTINDLKSPTMYRIADEDLDEVIQSSLARLQGDTFTLSIYFGRNVSQKYDRLALRLFNIFPAPLLRAQFSRESDRWRLISIAPISTSDIPDEHRPFLYEVADAHFSGNRRVGARGRRLAHRCDLAILYPDDPAALAPSSPQTIRRFVRAARRLGIDAEIVSRDDYGRIAEFDALFIRETTAVNHHTYRFARRAAAEGLVVIDDPQSIVRCSNKVFLAEMLERHGIGHPRTFVAHRDNIEDIPLYVGFPCVLKLPDSSFSQGVIRVDEPAALEQAALDLLARSDLIIAQEFLPSEFDWRVGVLDSKPLFVCKYHMARGHWQITSVTRSGERKWGRVESMPVEQAPPRVVSAAVRAARQIGNGLYGVDVKQVRGRAYVIEVNDNPNIDAGYEDRILGESLYTTIMQTFLDRVQRLRAAPQPRR